MLEILDKAYNWLYDFLTDNLTNLEKRNEHSMFHDYIYYKGNEPILAYNKEDGVNDIGYYGFWLIFESYMGSYLNDTNTLKLLIQGYITNVLNMEGVKVENQLS